MDDKSVKHFNGEDEDAGKALRKWKTWAQAKLLTIKDLKTQQRGPWLLTLLDGKAWDACEHLTLEELATAEGEAKLWDTLERRFPEKEKHDMMGEALGEVFGLAASESETMKQWTARVREVFDRCERRASVKFPPEAEGWIALNCAGLSEEQKAIVKAKAQGNLSFEVLSAALRSCFPVWKASASKRKPVGAFQVDQIPEVPPGAEDDDDSYSDPYMQGVQAFLAEHQQDAEIDEQVYSEGEAAEALAVSWKERRKEITKVQRSRQFGQSYGGTGRRQFKVEVEELKRRTKCNRCGKIGHWARECRQQPNKTTDNSGSTSSQQATSANYVEDTSAHDAAEALMVSGDDLTPAFVGHVQEVFSTGLVSSPGFGVVDSGCGKTLIGRQTLSILEKMIQQHGHTVQYFPKVCTFRFGNGATETSQVSCRLPVGIAQQYGLIDAAVIAGSAPLLLGRPTLEKMAVKLDFSNNKMELLHSQAQMHTNESGQLLIDVLAFPRRKSESSWTPLAADERPSRISEARPTKVKTKITLKKKECRCLLAQVKKMENQQGSKCLVAELFSPPRFSKEAENMGYHGLSYDIKQGWNLSKPEIQKQVDEELENARPRLLVVCPPCTHRGGWEHLNRHRRSALETARLIRESRMHVRFAAEQIRKQLDRGGDFLFEHPWGANTWDDNALTPLRRKYGVRRVDMYAYGLKCPDTNIPIRKATGLMTSAKPEHMHLFKQCPGCLKHRHVEGKLHSGERVSTYVAEYTSQFVQCMMQWCLNNHGKVWKENIDLAACGDTECLVGEANPAAVESVHKPEDQEGSNAKLLTALRRLHVNLGHPSNHDLVRILQHSKAKEEVVVMARSFECSICRNHQQPQASLPAKASRCMEFNSRVGMDVKYLPGWRPNQRVPCVSIIDYGSSLHVMTPIFQRETAELLKGVLRDSWLLWAGAPEVLELDPSRPNLSDALGEYCEGHGINLMHTAADSHWQLGKVERHGQWFEKILSKVHEENPPTSPEEFVENVMQTQIAKNSLITVAGASPYQIVFGKNPRIPQDLMQDKVHLPAVDASVFETAFQRSQCVRQSARLAVLQCQDSKAFKAAIRARPRVRQTFVSGDWVFYWRSQKWQEGSLIRGGKWHGAGMILGKLGQNYIVAHRRSIFRCSPEQLRHTTTEEKTMADFDANELLGIKNLLERGQFPKGQFIDLVNSDNPPEPEILDRADLLQVAGKTAAQMWQEGQAESEDTPMPEAKADVSGPEVPEEPRIPRTEDYGPIRRIRHTQKSPPEYLMRPPAMQMDDINEVFTELVPMLETHFPAADQPFSSPRGTSSKREASQDIEDSRHTRSRLSEEDEVLLSSIASDVSPWSTWSPIDCLIAGFLQKRAQKEIPVHGNEPELQAKVDASKTLEWETLSGKQAIRVWKGAKAREIRNKHPDRFIGSRFVVINKKDEDGERIKSRWCLQGHLDPDFQEKIRSGACHSPTLHPLSRSLVLQILVSRRWTMQLGDIKGAFLEAGPLNPKFAPLYAHQPKGGVPGLDPEDVIEVTGNVYGSNDAPFNWWFKFDETARSLGWIRSQFDNCLYYLPDKSGNTDSANMCGVLGAHVDDTITGGEGPVYEQAIARLKQAFLYRKWRVGNGEFCGVVYTQDQQSFEITYQQSEYAKHIRPISVSKERLKDKEAKATEREVSALRAINGAANWLSSQTRPDLCVQTSFSQQCFPEPRVRDLLFANQLVHRAKQFSGTEITVKHIPWDSLAICYHSDAGFGNAKHHKTQAGYIAAFVDERLVDNESSPWSPFSWRSYKLPRVVASTLAGEAQSFTTASATAEWMSLLLAEAKQGHFDLRTSEQVQQQPRIPGVKCRDEIQLAKVVGITDCKSLYDHMASMSSVSKCEDKRMAIDLAILKQCMSRTGLFVRWCPTELMLADGLTKDAQDPADLLRAALNIGEYQLNPEAVVLEKKKQQKQERLIRRMQHEAREKEARLQKHEKFRYDKPKKNDK